jgi:hypothetical protein
MAKMLAGGCLCGTVRYRIEADAIDAGYCHCRLCQHANAAPTVAWATFARPAVVWTTGTPRTYQSTPRAQRGFCANCGTQLCFETEGQPRRIDITIASLDDPAALAPEYHIWTASQIPWFEVSDELPRYVDAGPDV